MLETIQERLEATKNGVYAAQAKTVKEFAGLKHCKADLEKMLAYNIVELEFLPKDAKSSADYRRIICTGNQRFVYVYRAKKEADVKKRLLLPFVGMHTKDPFSVDVYDLVEGKQKTVSLKSWRVVFFVTLMPENVLVLNNIAKECLRK